MKLTASRRNFVNYIRGRGQYSVSQLAEQLNKKKTFVRYELKQLIEREVIAGRNALVDVRILGFLEYNVYLAVSYACESSRELLFATIDTHPNVTWFSEVGGRFQLCLNVQVRFSSEIVDLIATIGNLDGIVVTGRSLSHRLGLMSVPYDRGDSSEAQSTFSMQKTTSPVANKGPGRSVIQVLQAHCVGTNSGEVLREIPSNRRVAQFLSISPASVDRAIRELRDRKIIYGYIWRTTYTAVPLTKYKLLLSCKNIGSNFRQRLGELCALTPKATHLTECIGNWDYEVSIEVESPREVSAFSSYLYYHLGSEISGLESIPVFGYGTFKPVAPAVWEHLLQT